VMDLVFEESSVLVGADYKVMKKPASLSAEYQQQQRIYAEALHRLYPGHKIVFEFWWLA
jgi:ATP-dependent exoDNAse (exonuclease V) beta subunit